MDASARSKYVFVNPGQLRDSFRAVQSHHILSQFSVQSHQGKNCIKGLTLTFVPVISCATIGSKSTHSIMADEDHERPAPSDLAEEAGRSFAGMSLDDVKDHAFWETQPVGQLKPELDKSGPEGPIDDLMTVDEVKKEGYHLPPSFEWCTCDITDKKVNDEVFELLDNNYVEDDDAMFRFQYSRASSSSGCSSPRGTSRTGTWA